MNFPQIAYLEWAQEYMGRIRYDLGSSFVHPMAPREFVLPPESAEISLVADQEHAEIVRILADRYQTGPENIWLTNGVTPGLFLAYSLMLDRGDTVLLEAPNYEPLYRMARHFNAEVRILERSFERNFQLDLEELERKISRNARAIVLSNYHNPSGVATDQDKLTTIAQIAHDYGCKVLIDEVYMPPQPKPSASTEENVIFLHSFSKIYGIRGLRAGWIVGPEEFIRACRAANDYLGAYVSPMTVRAALHVLKQSEMLLARSGKILAENLSALKSWIHGREHLQWIPPDGGTTSLIKLPHGTDAMTLSHHLREKYQTLVVPGDFFWLKGYIRVCLGAEPETFRSGLQNLGKALDDLHGKK